MTNLLTFNYWPHRWLEVPDYQLANARKALNPMPGTVMVEIQPPIEETESGIQLVQQRGARTTVGETWAVFPPLQPTAGTVVAIGDPVADFVTDAELRALHDQATMRGVPGLTSPHMEDYDPVDIKVGDKVMVRYEHGNGFTGWWTPPYTLGPKQELKIFGRLHIQTDADLPFADAYFVPMHMSIPATIDGENLIPTGRNVILEREVLRDKSNSGLIELPSRLQSRSTFAIVKAVGPRVRDLKVGDRVVYSPGTLRYWRGNTGDALLAIASETSILSKAS